MSSIARPTPSPSVPSVTGAGARLVAVTALTLACFAANSLLCRAALATRQIDAAGFTAIRIAAGAVTLAAIAAGRGGWRGGGSWVSALALFVYAAAFSVAYLRITAGTGALLLFAAVQATMIGWSIVRGVRPTPIQWIGIAVALSGLGYLVAPGIARPDPVGAALMILAGIAWGCYSVRGRGAKHPLSTTADNFLRAVPLSVVLLFLAAPARPSVPGVALAVASGAVASGVGYSLWYGVLPLLGATHAAVVQLAVPVLAALGAVALLGEPLTARLTGAGAAVLAGIALVATQKRTPPR